MTFLQIFTLSASLVTIFAFIVGIFSVYNGRMTRKAITELINTTTAQTHQMLGEMQQTLSQMHQTLSQMHQTFSQMHQTLNKMTEILDRMDARLERIEKPSGSS